VIDNGPVILAFDTSSTVTSIAVAKGSNVVAIFGAEINDRRSERLWTHTTFLLSELGLGFDDVDLFAVCVGPGGFTGIRVGLAAVKGFAFGSGKPVAGVGSLEAIASAVQARPSVCVVRDAYREEVYAQIFEYADEGGPVAMGAPTITPAGELPRLFQKHGELAVAGDEPVAFRAGREFKRAPRFLAEHVARLGFAKHLRGETSNAREVKALYVRPSDAETKLELGLLK
jgi:tRNA threonylcarbamoyladenosine biosynthesis protein TsaB